MTLYLKPAQPLAVFIFDATEFHQKTSLFNDNTLILLEIIKFL